MHFVNEMKTANAYSQACPITIYSDMKNEYRLGGCLDRHWGVQSRSLAIRNVLNYAEVEVATMLRERGINFDGDVEQKPTPSFATSVVVHASQPLYVVIRHTLKNQIIYI